MAKGKYIFVILLSFLSYTIAYGQNLNGEQIKVSDNMLTVLKFNDKITDCRFGERKGYIFHVTDDDNCVRIKIDESAPPENPATNLVVSEGKRTHYFKILYVKDLDYNKISLYYDYSNLKVLKNKVRLLELQAQEADNSTTKEGSTSKTQETQTNTTPVPKESSTNTQPVVPKKDEPVAKDKAEIEEIRRQQEEAEKELAEKLKQIAQLKEKQRQKELEDKRLAQEKETSKLLQEKVEKEQREKDLAEKKRQEQEKAKALAELKEKQRLKEEAEKELAAQIQKQKQEEEKQKALTLAEAKEKQRLKDLEDKRLADEVKKQKQLEEQEKNKALAELKEKQRLKEEAEKELTAQKAKEQQAIKDEEKKKALADLKEKQRLKEEAEQALAGQIKEQKKKEDDEKNRLLVAQLEQQRLKAQQEKELAEEVRLKKIKDDEEKKKALAELKEKQRLKEEAEKELALQLKIQKQKEDDEKKKQDEALRIQKTEQARIEKEIAEAAARKEREIALARKRYNNEGLYNRFPGISFKDPPFGQYLASDYFLESEVNNNKIFMMDSCFIAPQNVSITSDAVNNIVLSLENISFDRTNAFYRFKISNNSKDDFLTGKTSVAWYKSLDSSGRYVYITYAMSRQLPADDGTVAYVEDYTFPLVPPGQSAYWIISTRAVTAGNNHHLLFTVLDRYNKTKLELLLPGTEYNKEGNFH